MIDRPRAHGTGHSALNPQASTLAAMSSEGSPVAHSPRAAAARHYHAVSTSAALDFMISNDWKDELLNARRPSSDCIPWPSCTEMTARPSSLLLAPDFLGDVPSITVDDSDPEQNPADDDLILNFGDLLNELELLARTVKFLPIPTPPSSSLSALSDAFVSHQSSPLSVFDMVSVLVVHAFATSCSALEPLSPFLRCRLSTIGNEYYAYSHSQ